MCVIFYQKLVSGVLKPGFPFVEGHKFCARDVYGVKAAIHGKEAQSIQLHHTRSYKLTAIYINDAKCLRCKGLTDIYILGLSELLGGLHGLLADCRITSEASLPSPMFEAHIRLSHNHGSHLTICIMIQTIHKTCKRWTGFWQ